MRRAGGARCPPHPQIQDRHLADITVCGNRTIVADALHVPAHTCKGKKGTSATKKEDKHLMLGITRIHRYVRPLPASQAAASGRDVNGKPGARLAAKLTALLCTPRAVPPYLWVDPERAPVDRLPPT